MTRYIGDVRRGARRRGQRRSAARVPDDPQERARPSEGGRLLLRRHHGRRLRVAGSGLLATPIRNPSLPGWWPSWRRSQPKSFAAGIDMILADVLDSARKTLGPIPHHTHALVFLVEYTRDPTPGEPGTDWFAGTPGAARRRCSRPIPPSCCRAICACSATRRARIRRPAATSI